MANNLLQNLQERAAFVESLTKKKTTLLDAADAIHRAAMSAGRAFTAEERTTLEANAKEAEEINDSIKLTERMGNAYRDQPTRVEVTDNTLAEPWVPEARGSENKAQRYERHSHAFGKFLRSVRDAELLKGTGEKGDPRLYAANAEFAKRAAAAGASEMVPSDGGFLVAPDFSNMVLELAHETGIVYPMTRDLPISEFTNAIKIPAVDERSRADGSRWGGIQMFWEQEAQSLVGSKPTFALLELVLKKLTGLFYATNELLADARTLGDISLRGFGQEMGFKLDDGCIRGTGAGQLQGILNAPALVSVSKETGQLAATIVLQNILKMWGRMVATSRNNAVWLVNQDCEPQLMQLSLAVGAGGVPVFLPAGVGVFGSLAAPPLVSTKEFGGMSGTLLGRPVYTIEQCATLGTPGDIILADWQQFIMIKKDGLQAASSQHVRFLSDELVFRYIYRTDGQSWFKTAITPANGSTRFRRLWSLQSERDIVILRNCWA